MPDKAVLALIRKFLGTVEQAGIPVFAGVLFGSHARGDAHKDSDIDLLVISSNPGKTESNRNVDLLWRLRSRVDYRIEPLLVTKKRWDTDDGSPMLASIRQEGLLIRPRRRSPSYSSARRATRSLPI
jgi:predicted nucleotidyltransferase